MELEDTMKKQYKVVVSRRAKIEMENHVSFLARVNIKSAKTLKDNLIKDIKKSSVYYLITISSTC